MLPALRSGWVKRSRIHMRSAFFSLPLLPGANLCSAHPRACLCSLPGGVEVQRREAQLKIFCSQALVEPKTPTIPIRRLDDHLLPTCTTRGQSVELVAEKPLAPQMVLR
jgi:hypothetical protein